MTSKRQQLPRSVMATKEQIEAGARAIAAHVNSPNCANFDHCGAGVECACRTDAKLAIEAAEQFLEGFSRDYNAAVSKGTGA